MKVFFKFLLVTLGVFFSSHSFSETQLLVGERTLVSWNSEDDGVSKYFFSKRDVGFDSKYDKYKIIVESEYDLKNDSKKTSDVKLKLTIAKNRELCFFCRDGFYGFSTMFALGRSSRLKHSHKKYTSKGNWIQNEMLEVSEYFTSDMEAALFMLESDADEFRPGNLYVTILAVTEVD